MKTALSLSPVLLAILVPAALPAPVRVSYGHYRISSDHLSHKEFLTVRGDDGSVLINWPRVEAEVKRCGPHIDCRLSCGIARALVAARDGSWRNLP